MRYCCGAPFCVHDLPVYLTTHVQAMAARRVPITLSMLQEKLDNFKGAVIMGLYMYSL
jgi:hypothetical protein